MDPKQNRENWGSKLGFIMAAAGSAVGLGNIWKFPYTAGMNGGGAFVLIYLFFVVVIGFSVMLTEFAIGRRKQLAAVGAFKSVDRRWTFAGILGVFSGLLVMGFYPVVGGWALAYVYKVATGLLNNIDTISTSFSAFTKAPTEPLIWMGIYLVLNIAIVVKGISSGIEKAGKVLMPLLFAILILIAARGLFLPNAMAGVAFLFKPDFSVVNGQVILAALGQAFFSLSLGMGCMITYGSYLSKDENLVENAALVTTMDTAVALLSGLAMFPAMFAFGIEPSQGPGLVFVVVPTLFANMGGALGLILGLLFFIALSVAALTSSVSLLEVVVAYLIDERNFTRVKAVLTASVAMAVMCVFASLSVGNSNIGLFDVGVFDIFDALTDKVFLAIGGLLVSIFAGWKLGKDDLYKEVTNDGKIKFRMFNVWFGLVKFIIPITILLVAVSGVVGGFESGKGPIMLIGIGIIAIFAIFSKKL